MRGEVSQWLLLVTVMHELGERETEEGLEKERIPCSLWVLKSSLPGKIFIFHRFYYNIPILIYPRESPETLLLYDSASSRCLLRFPFKCPGYLAGVIQTVFESVCARKR